MNDLDASPVLLPLPFTNYNPAEPCYDELLTPGNEVQSRWEPVLKQFPPFSAEEMNRRTEQANALVQENGVTYNAHRADADEVRPWKLDLLPVVFAEDEWDHLERGLAQRSRLLNLILQDIYGPQRLIKDGVLPPAVVFENPNFYHPLHNLLPEDADYLCFYGAELARTPQDGWRVMADRTTSPRGAGYALENRVIISRSLPRVITNCKVRRMASFFQFLQEQLRRMAPRNQENPHVVLLTPGPTSPFYFEDAYLAGYLGYTLVQCDDLTVRDQRVWLKTLSGLMPVEVIFRRVNDLSLDPLELGAYSPQGIPGLLQAIRERNVAVVNAPGCSFGEPPVLMAHLPQCCEALLGESLVVPSIATWWCGDPQSSTAWNDNFTNLVIKPAYKRSGIDEIVVSELSTKAQEELRQTISASPSQYIAQEKVLRSSTPSWYEGKIQPGHTALRLYTAGMGDECEAMPGGLARASTTPAPLKLSIGAGDFSKDVWVISRRKQSRVSLLPGPDSVLQLRRSGLDLPSRVADNLYWLGRQLQRAESATRLVRETLRRLTGETELENLPELPGCLRALAAAGQIDARDVIEDFGSDLTKIQKSLPASVLGTDEDLSLRQLLNRVYELASSVRDRLSGDTWRTLNRMHEDCAVRVSSKSLDLNDLWDFSEHLLRELSAAYGQIAGGMIRGPAWRFLDLGIRIEKSQQIIQLLSSTLVTKSRVNTALLQAILEIADVIMTYRSRYFAQFQVGPLLDLLLVDETNPGSLAWQLLTISSHVDRLPRPATMAERSPEQRSILNALHLVQTMDIGDLTKGQTSNRRGPLDRFLRDVKQELHHCHQHVTQTYLTHTGTPRLFPDS